MGDYKSTTMFISNMHYIEDSRAVKSSSRFWSLWGAPLTELRAGSFYFCSIVQCLGTLGFPRSPKSLGKKVNLLYTWLHTWLWPWQYLSGRTCFHLQVLFLKTCSRSCTILLNLMISKLQENVFVDYLYSSLCWLYKHASQWEWAIYLQLEYVIVCCHINIYLEINKITRWVCLYLDNQGSVLSHYMQKSY